MAFNTLTRAALMVAILGVTACTANINATTPGGNLGGGGGETAKAAIQVSETDPEVTKLDLGDLTPYRIECPDSDQVNKTWIIYYYSAKTQKSYRCNTRIGAKVEFIEVTDADSQYRPGAEIDETKWKVDSEQAKTNAVQVVQKVNVNVTQIKVKTLVLLSAAEFTRRTGTPSQDPVWVCTVDPGTGASPSPTMSPTPSPSVSPSVSPEPTASPSASPSVAPSASPSPTTLVNNITNVYINANNGNQINVNTGTQTNTTTTQTM